MSPVYNKLCGDLFIAHSIPLQEPAEGPIKHAWWITKFVKGSLLAVLEAASEFESARRSWAAPLRDVLGSSHGEFFHCFIPRSKRLFGGANNNNSSAAPARCQVQLMGFARLGGSARFDYIIPSNF